MRAALLLWAQGRYAAATLALLSCPAAFSLYIYLAFGEIWLAIVTFVVGSFIYTPKTWFELPASGTSGRSSSGLAKEHGGIVRDTSPSTTMTPSELGQFILAFISRSITDDSDVRDLRDILASEGAERPDALSLSKEEFDFRIFVVLMSRSR